MLGLFDPQNYSWRQQRKFHLQRDSRKSTKFIICNGLVRFELGLDRLGRSNQVKLNKNKPML